MPTGQPHKCMHSWGWPSVNLTNACIHEVDHQSTSPMHASVRLTTGSTSQMHAFVRLTSEVDWVYTIMAYTMHERCLIFDRTYHFQVPASCEAYNAGVQWDQFFPNLISLQLQTQVKTTRKKWAGRQKKESKNLRKRVKPQWREDPLSSACCKYHKRWWWWWCWWETYMDIYLRWYRKRWFDLPLLFHCYATPTSSPPPDINCQILKTKYLWL